MTLSLTRAARGKVVVDRRGPDGSLLSRASSTFLSQEDFVEVAETLGVSTEELARAVDEFERTGSVSEQGAASIAFLIRDIAGGAEAVSSANTDALAGLLACVATKTSFVDPVISWDSPTALAAVDLDAEGWDVARLSSLLVDLRPTPSLAWVTKGGGLRLVYVEHGSLTAEELAAVACLYLSTTVSYRSLELKSDTRPPASEVLQRHQDADAGALRRWLRQYQVDDEEVAAWLAERGMEVDGRYDHHLCPISPSAEGARQPVCVGERGIHCFVCEARGEVRGGGRAGFVPYASLVGGQSATVLYYCLDNFAHWEHVRRVMTPMFKVGARIAELAYRAAIKLHHEGVAPAVVDRIMQSGKNLVRMDGRWATCDGKTYMKDLPSILSQLPAACVLDRGKLRISRSKLAVLQQTFDLTEYGYPSLTPVYGMPVFGQHLDYMDEETRIIVQTDRLSCVKLERYRPRYESNGRRLPLDEAWGELDRVFPGLNRDLVQLLIAARGVSEAGVSMPPMVYISGPTSAAKTSTIHVAAAAIGDNVTEVVWTENVERVRQAVADSKESGTYVAFNEILKEMGRSKQAPTQAAEFILNLTPGSVSWKAYIGPVRLGALPVFVWTDTHVPIEIKQHAQLARRLVHVHLPAQVDWRTTLSMSGVLQPDRIRIASQSYARACDTIASETIDRYFRRRWTFEDIAADLGFSLMSESTEAMEGADALAEFFRAVCDAPPLAGADATRWSGRGWKMVQRGHETPIVRLWEQVCDADWTTSTRCSEPDWAKIVRAKEAVRFECKSHGTSKVAVRFRSVAGTRQDYRVNEELL